VEQIDIGGPSMVRSAAKNHAYVAVRHGSVGLWMGDEGAREQRLPHRTGESVHPGFRRPLPRRPAMIRRSPPTSRPDPVDRWGG